MPRSFSTTVLEATPVLQQPAAVEHPIVINAEPVVIQHPQATILQQGAVTQPGAALFHRQSNLIRKQVAAIQQVQQMAFLTTYIIDNNIYLLNYADAARWASGQLIDADNSVNNIDLPWMGGEGDSIGFVRLDDGVVMEDGQAYRALRTHPQWADNGTIKGWMPWVKQDGTGTFKAQVGFLNGAAGSDGVTFQVWVHYHRDGIENWEKVINQQKFYNGQLQEISADLSSWAYEEISIELRVDSGPSSAQDWAAWINPRIEIGPVAQIPGPIISDDNPVFFNDRYDNNKKWYWPDFELKQPLQDNFTFSCYKNAQPGDDGNYTYNGEVNFRLLKNTPPAAITSLARNNQGVAYTEIMLNNLSINFVVTLTLQDATTKVIPFAGTVTQVDNEFTLLLKSVTLSAPEDQEKYLLTLFNFLSNADNANYCTLSVTGSYFGYTSNPVQNDYISNSSLNFSKIFNKVNYPCSAYPNNYFIKDGDPFGCNLPFGVTAVNNHIYTLYNLDLFELGINHIYRNQVNLKSYLIIPTKYTIMLEPASVSSMDQLIPAAYLNTVVDVTNTANCTATFQFHIAPDISEYQLRSIKKMIFEKTKIPNSSYSIDDIHIEFPETIYQPETIVFEKANKTKITGLGSNEYGVRGSRYFQLEVSDVSIANGSAELISKIIKGQMGGTSMVSPISFNVDSSDFPNPQSSVDLSLNKISGNFLLLLNNETNNKVYFLNRTFYDISITAITSDTETSINPTLPVSKNNSVEAPSPVTADNFSSIIPKYAYIPNEDYINSVLKEMRINVDQTVSDSIIVTNNTGLFTRYKIKQIDIVIYIVPQSADNAETASQKAIATVNKSIITDGVINEVPFFLPVAASSNWSAVYSTTIAFNDKPNQANGKQFIENSNSKFLNLTVSNLGLAK